ncbi:microsomal glutathione S-transferase 2 [Biomphalaria pfeifferi]|uniref:Microsomal glutathione S-transferase 2 n=1 Tax=Biomphalaria pfeifferi TaxID=112525 RepID=A0AAD8BZA9_BIOPF|nr:microsomal glutathione S-transferase 2 [Biomphalaria pfeifferi]
MTSFPIDKYALPAAVTVAGIHQMFTFAKSVGNARRKYNVQVPETAGPPEFVRVFRAHQNSLEFYPISLAGLWIGSVFFHPVPASVFYGVYLLGRKRYFDGYAEREDKRLPGFYFSLRCLMGLSVLCLLGVGHKLVRYYEGVDLLTLLQEKLPIIKN